MFLDFSFLGSQTSENYIGVNILFHLQLSFILAFLLESVNVHFVSYVLSPSSCKRKIRGVSFLYFSQGVNAPEPRHLEAISGINETGILVIDLNPVDIEEDMNVMNIMVLVVTDAPL